MYFQDDWRVTDRLTVNAGLRYDIVTGFDLDQSKIPNYIALTGAARRADSTACRLRGVRQRARRGHQQLAAAYRRRLRPARRRQGRRPRRLGRLLRLRLHQRQHPVPGAERAGRFGHDLQHHWQDRRHPERGRQLLQRSASRSRTSRARTKSTRTGRSTARNVAAPGIRQPWTSQISVGLVARADAVDGVRRRLRARRRQATSASGGRSTRGSTAATGATPICR